MKERILEGNRINGFDLPFSTHISMIRTIKGLTESNLRTYYHFLPAMIVNKFLSKRLVLVNNTTSGTVIFPFISLQFNIECPLVKSIMQGKYQDILDVYRTM